MKKINILSPKKSPKKIFQELIYFIVKLKFYIIEISFTIAIMSYRHYFYLFFLP